MARCFDRAQRATVAKTARVALVGLLFSSCIAFTPRRHVVGRQAPRLSLSLPGPLGLEQLRARPAPGSFSKPAGLPRLSREDIGHLTDGKIVQRQTRDGVTGNGFVVMDLEASPETVWSLLLDFERYPEMISTVRSAALRPGSTLERARATFVLSKFLLEVNVVHQFDRRRQQLRFCLDSASQNLIMKQADGFWYVETPDVAEGLKPGHVRIWFGASIRVSRIVPRWVTDYAAQRALRRATAWLRPTITEAEKASLDSVGVQQSTTAAPREGPEDL